MHYRLSLCFVIRRFALKRMCPHDSVMRTYASFLRLGISLLKVSSERPYPLICKCRYNFTDPKSLYVIKPSNVAFISQKTWGDSPFYWITPPMLIISEFSVWNSHVWWNFLFKIPNTFKIQNVRKGLIDNPRGSRRNNSQKSEKTMTTQWWNQSRLKLALVKKTCR